MYVFMAITIQNNMYKCTHNGHNNIYISKKRNLKVSPFFDLQIFINMHDSVKANSPLV